MNKIIKVLELNNLDTYGKRFNGYSIAKYVHKQPHSDFDIKLIVNHKFSKSRFVLPLFKNSALENADWRIEELENLTGTKNQISLSSNALIKHRSYKTANILHFHMYHNMHFPIEFLTQISSDKKIILDFHDTFWLTDKNIPMLEVFAPSNINKTSLNAQRKRVLNSINAEFVVHSSYMLDLFKKSTVTKNLSANLINFGIDLNVFKPLRNTEKVRAKYKISQNDIVLLFRTQKAFKGVEYIKEALNSLNVNKKIVLLTVGGETGLIDNLSKKYRIKEFGMVNSEAKMAEIYNLADIFLSPSTEESFGFMAVEAMACGKPVIVFDGTALPKTVNAPHAGISVPKSSKELKKAIEHLIDNPSELKERGIKSLKFVTSKYDEKKYLEKNLSLYKKIISKNNPSINNKTNTKTTSKHYFDGHFKDIKNFLLGEQIALEPLLLNYNSMSVQKDLYSFNEKLYYSIMKEQSSSILKRGKNKLYRTVDSIMKRRKK